MRLRFGTAAIVALFMTLPMSARAQEQNTAQPIFTSTPTVLLRSPDPIKLAEFYKALGMKVARVSERGSTFIYLEGNAGSLEILKMDPNTQPDGPKTSRTQ